MQLPSRTTACQAATGMSSIQGMPNLPLHCPRKCAVIPLNLPYQYPTHYIATANEDIAFGHPMVADDPLVDPGSAATQQLPSFIGNCAPPPSRRRQHPGVPRQPGVPAQQHV